VVCAVALLFILLKRKKKEHPRFSADSSKTPLHRPDHFFSSENNSKWMTSGKSSKIGRLPLDGIRAASSLVEYGDWESSVAVGKDALKLSTCMSVPFLNCFTLTAFHSFCNPMHVRHLGPDLLC
jgi:hypothetical protein